jgi:hypothetical protein
VQGTHLVFSFHFHCIFPFLRSYRICLPSLFPSFIFSTLPLHIPNIYNASQIHCPSKHEYSINSPFQSSAFLFAPFNVQIDSQFKKSLNKYTKVLFPLQSNYAFEIFLKNYFSFKLIF